MDPFSITVGIVGLVDGGLSLSKDLKTKIHAFQNAGREVVELAHEIDLCTTLLDVLGDSLESPENAYPKNIVKQTKRLVEDMRNVFRDVETLLASFDYSTIASSKYMIKAETFRGHHDKLKGLQLSFIFMLSVYPAQRTPPPMDPMVSSSSTLAQLGSFEGTIQHVPVYTGSRDPKSGSPITYKATLTLQPAVKQTHAGASDTAESSSSRPDFTDRLEEARKDKRLKRKLAALTSNPFFSKETFGSMFARKPEARLYRPEPGRVRHSDSFASPVAYSVSCEDTAYNEEVGKVKQRSNVGTSEYGEHSQERKAEKDVDDILAYLFDNSDDFRPEYEEVSGEDIILETYPAAAPMGELATQSGSERTPFGTNGDFKPPKAQTYPTEYQQGNELLRLQPHRAHSPPSRYSTPFQEANPPAPAQRRVNLRRL